MLSFLSFLPLIMSILTGLPALIKMAETAFGGGPGNGQAKKDLVMATAQAAITIHDSVTGNPLPQNHTDVIMKTLGSLTDATVQVFNAVGVFKKGTPIVPPPIAS